MFNSVVASAALLCIASSVQGLTFKSAKDQPCFKVTKPEIPKLDLKWVHSLNPMYLPMTSNDNLFRMSINILKKDARDVSLDSVYYNACIKWYMHNNGTAISKGFNGLTREYKIKTLSDNHDAFTFVPVGGDKDVYSGTLYATLTDNKSFFFGSSCLGNGEMTWGVGSATPKLTEEIKKKILDHAVSLGFNREDFTELKYDLCKN